MIYCANALCGWVCKANSQTLLMPTGRCQYILHPHDRPLFGMVWRGLYFVDCTLPFGLHSARLIFSGVAEALEWVAQSKGAQCLFLFVGPPGTDGCARDLRAFLQSCDELSVVRGFPQNRGACHRPHGVRHRDRLWLDGNAPAC